MSPGTTLILLLLINSFLIASGSGFQLRSRWLATMTTTKHVGRSGATGYHPQQQQQQQHPFGIHMPRGGSSDVVLDLLAVDDDEDEDAAEDDDDDEDDDGGETHVESVRDQTDEPLEEKNSEVEDKIVDDDGSKATLSRLDNKEDKEEKTADDEDEDDDDLEDEEELDGPPVATSSQPINIVFKTNMGNPLIDTSLELLVSRSRTVENVKQSLSRMLPGRPPPEVMRLVSEGILLRDDELINDVVDDDEDLDDEDEEASTVTMLLDMVPPVDPKFATQLQNMNEVSTSDLLDAYAANSAAMYHPTNDADQQGDLLSVQLRHEAHTIREQLLETFPEKSLAALYAETLSSEFVEDRRGQRYRTSMGGARANLKRILQTNLNINWAGTIRNFLLFLFFGLFGGRSTMSRNLLLLGAPMCFLLQARVVKLYLKLAFYACAHPPSILLSLLPAPQQAILSFKEEEARKILYPEAISKTKSKKE